MSDFLSSTQAKHWLLTPSQLTARREAAQPHPTLPTASQEALLAHHSKRILHICSSLNLPFKFAATAITYFKRFYIDHSIVSYDPAAISLLSLYTAGKVEEIVISADDLVVRADQILNGVDPKTDFISTPHAKDGSSRVPSGVLLRVELMFVEELRFHLIVFHPYRSLGIIRETLKSKLPEGKPMAKLMACAEYIITQRGLLSDLPLTQPPAVIAAAATILAAQETGTISADEVLPALGMVSISARVEEAVQQMQPPAEPPALQELETERRRLCSADNFLTQAFAAELADHDLEAVDREETERSKRVRAENEALLASKKVRVN